MPPFSVWDHFHQNFQYKKMICFVNTSRRLLSAWPPSALKFSDKRTFLNVTGWKLYLDHQGWMTRTQSEWERWDCCSSCHGKCPQHELNRTSLPSKCSSPGVHLLHYITRTCCVSFARYKRGECWGLLIAQVVPSWPIISAVRGFLDIQSWCPLLPAHTVCCYSPSLRGAHL